MTEQELINYITDRVDTNNSFGVSAKDVQEAIVQVVNELYDPAFSGASSLQEVLDQGSEADSSSFGSIDILNGGDSETRIDGESISINKSFTDGSSNLVEISKSISSELQSYEYKVSSLGVITTVSNTKGQGDVISLNGIGGKFGSSDYSLNFPSTSWTFIEPSLGLSLSKTSSATSSSIIGQDSNQGGYVNSVSSSQLEFKGETLSGGSIQSKYRISSENDNFGVNPFGTKLISVTTKPENTSFEPKSTWSIDGGLQVADMEEETSTPEYALVPDSDGVIKKYPFPVKESEFGSFILDGGSVLELDKLYSSVYIEFDSSGDVTIKLPNPLTEEHIGDWFFLNNNSFLSQGSRITVISEDGNGLYNSGLIPADGSLTLKIVRLRTAPQTNAFISKFVEIQKDTI